MKISTISLLFFQLFFVGFVWCTLPSCKDAQISTKSYTTKDATVLSQIAYISEFRVKCNPISVKPGNLYALFKDNIIPAANVAPNKYQISWTEDLKSAQVGDITVKIFDEEGYSALKKSLRNGENVRDVPHFLTITINHPGSYKGPCISCEFLAAILSLIIAYYAIHLRVKYVS